MHLLQESRVKIFSKTLTQLDLKEIIERESLLVPQSVQAESVRLKTFE